MGDLMASSIDSLLGFVSIALAATALTRGSAAAGTLDNVKQGKTIRLAMRDDAPPFSYKDKTGQPAGGTSRTAGVDVKRSSGIAMVEVEVGTTTLPVNDTGLRPRRRSEGNAIPCDRRRLEPPRRE